jgi:hypothetical protein
MYITKFHFPAAALGLALTVLNPTQAAAQKAGVYSGTLTNGDTISLTVTETSGVFKVTLAAFNFTKPIACGTNATTVDPDIAFNPSSTITSGKTTFTLKNIPIDFIHTTATFTSTKATGTVVADFAAFAAFTSKPTKSIFCHLATLDFTATYAAPTAEPRAPKLVLF